MLSLRRPRHCWLGGLKEEVEDSPPAVPSSLSHRHPLRSWHPLPTHMPPAPHVHT